MHSNLGSSLLRRAAVLTVALQSFVAAAQTTEQAFSLSRFEAAERGSSWFFGDSLDFRGNVAWSAGVVGDYAYKPLVIYSDSGAERAVVVRNYLQFHAGGSVVLLERVRVGVSLPVLAFADGGRGQLTGVTLGAPVGPAIGDLRVAADVRVVGTEGDAFTLAAGGRVWFPTAGAMSYGGDGRWRLSPQLMAAGTFMRFKWSARVAYVWRERELAFPDSSIGSEATFGGTAGFTFFDGRLLVGPEVFATTRASTNEGFTEFSTPVEVMIGAHYRGSSWLAGLGVSKGVVRGVGEPLFRVVASFEWAPSRERPRPLDGDGDGFVDANDACPNAAGATLGGCPDLDGDGVTDGKDACPSIAGVQSVEPARHGCRPETDADADGIVDALDACAEVPGAKSADASKNGCPSDADADGIVDAEDACVAEAGVVAEKKEFNGCPLTRDGDVDSVPDRSDACPTEPGQPHADPSINGCPVGALVAGQLVLDSVKFKSGSAEILHESDQTLTRVLETMKKLPETNRYLVEGHTDDRGSAASNRSLSQRRAQSVVSWFVNRGMAASRFDATGFGQDRPLAPNDSDDHRRANRRVEIHVVEGTTAAR